MGTKRSVRHVANGLWSHIHTKEQPPTNSTDWHQGGKCSFIFQVQACVMKQNKMWPTPVPLEQNCTFIKWLFGCLKPRWGDLYNIKSVLKPVQFQAFLSVRDWSAQIRSFEQETILVRQIFQCMISDVRKAVMRPNSTPRCTYSCWKSSSWPLRPLDAGKHSAKNILSFCWLLLTRFKYEWEYWSLSVWNVC